MKSNQKKFLINIITIFPEAFSSLLDVSVIGSAKKKGIWDLQITDIKKFADEKKNIDDRPYGGGPGMILKPDVLQSAYSNAVSAIEKSTKKYEKIMLTPRGERLNQDLVKEISKTEGVIIVCGRYEGVDQRFVDYNDLREISVGDFVVSGGEPAAIILADAIVRLLPNVLGNPLSLLEESFNNNLIEYLQYTKPKVWRNMQVPDVLLSGDHKRIKEWRLKKSLEFENKKKDR
ncbi:tRNA (guanosine(37)-N1)-methyltransferase TrmD [Alphaproteobacteria bacterium]|nr:tRNA (guanosine(37)-N1)-methyltransferase TrmD [Alphaproteobacteria bacterium]